MPIQPETINILPICDKSTAPTAPLAREREEAARREAEARARRREEERRLEERRFEEVSRVSEMFAKEASRRPAKSAASFVLTNRQ